MERTRYIFEFNENPVFFCDSESIDSNGMVAIPQGRTGNLLGAFEKVRHIHTKCLTEV